MHSIRPLRDIIGDVASDAQSLIRGEMALARVEFDRKLKRGLMALASDTRAAVQDAVNRGSDVAQAATDAGGQTLSEAAQATRDLGEKAGEHARALGEKTQASVQDVTEKTRTSAKGVVQATRQSASEVANRAGNTALVGKPRQ